MYNDLAKTTIGMENSAQIKRIKSKLIEASKTDFNFEVFGSNKHKYKIGNRATIQEVKKVEEKYSINLPIDYVDFITKIGNGGISYCNSAAGPFYGIYPLGSHTDELIYYETEKYLKNECILTPFLTDSDWKKITAKLNNDDISDEEYEIELGKVYGGILPLGSQGCSYIHGIILNGDYKGKIVNLDIDYQKPKFTFENNFLDWYERWLDEIISKELLTDSSWFGYTMRGTDEYLLHFFREKSSTQEKLNSLIGLCKKTKINLNVLKSLRDDYNHSNGLIKKELLAILVKNKFSDWKNLIVDNESLLSSFQLIYWYDKRNSKHWLEFILSNLKSIKHVEELRYASYILKESGYDYGNIIVDLLKSPDSSMRAKVIYSLSELKNKKNYLKHFIEALYDESIEVITYSLQGLSGIKNKELLFHYKNLAIKFNNNEEYLLSNLSNRLLEFNLSLEEIKTLDLTKYKKKRWFQFW